MGKKDIMKHSKSKPHREQAWLVKSQKNLHFTSSKSQSSQKKTEAELIMVILIASSNIPIAFHEKLSPTIRSVWSDSKVAINYH